MSGSIVTLSAQRGSLRRRQHSSPDGSRARRAAEREPRRLPRAVAVVVSALAFATVGPFLPRAEASLTPAITVSATIGVPGVDTGIDLTTNQSYSGFALGHASYGSDSFGGCSGTTYTDPDGNRFVAGTPCPSPSQKFDASAPAPTAPVGELIGRIGTSGAWFTLGSSFFKVAPASGRLYLLYNDGDPTNNTQGYTVSLFLNFTVASTQGAPGLATGVNVASGQVLGFTASGTGSYGYESEIGCVGHPNTTPAGDRSIAGVACTTSKKVNDPSAPLPGAPVGSLIAKVGPGGAWFAVGAQASVTMPAAGALFLAYNDGFTADNTGPGFTVGISPSNYPAASLPPTKPAAPTLTLVKVTDTAAQLSWPMASDPTVHYQLGYAEENQPYQTSDYGHVGGQTLGGLKARTPYNFFLEACVGSLCSDWSAGVRTVTAVVQLVGLEVNQASQDWNNSVPLIAGKETVVRAFVKLRDPGRPAPIAAVLHASRSGVELTSSPIRPMNPGGSALAETNLASRGVFNTSLNFVLPNDWENGTVTLSVDIAGGAVECREAAGPTANDCAATITFQNGPRASLKFYRVQWQDGSGNITMPNDSVFGVIADQIRREYPVSQLSYGIDTLGTIFNGVPTLDQVHAALIKQRADDGCNAGCNDVYFGMINNDTTPKPDKQAPGSELAGTVAAYTTSGGYRSLPMHEMGHAFGRPHTVTSAAPGGNSLTGLYSGWCGEQPAQTNEEFPYVQSGQPNPPFPNAKRYTIGPMDQGDNNLVYGLDTSNIYGGLADKLGVSDPNVVAELISYCDGAQDTQSQWASSYTYKKLVASNLVVTDGRPAAPAASPNGFFVATGSVATNGTVTVSDLSHTSATDPGAVAAASGPYTINLKSSSGTIVGTANFGASGGGNAPSIDRSVQQDPLPQFRVVISDPGSVASVALVKGATPLATFTTPTPAPTTLTISSPVSGATIPATLHVAWSTDQSNASLRSMVRYSPDGTTWKTLGFDLTATSMDVPSPNLAASTAGVIEVSESDGFRTVTSTVTPITITGTAPTVRIISPGVSSSFARDQTVTLDATAFDRTDGVLAPGAIRWSSNVDGPLGSGESVVVPSGTLTPGPQTLSASVTNAAGLTTTATVSVTVNRYAVAPPASSATTGGGGGGGGTPPPVSSPTVSQSSADGRIGTAIAASQQTFADAPTGHAARAAGLRAAAVRRQAGAVVLSRADLFPDAMAAAPLAGAHAAPVLLTDVATLDPRVQTEIDRVLGGSGMVYLVGGDQALSPAVASALQRRYTVLRYAGQNRYETAVHIAEGMNSPTTVFEVDGTNYPDSLTAAPAAAAVGGVVLLTDGPRAHASTTKYLAQHPGTRYAVGGYAAVADPAAIAIVGVNRYETSAAVASRFFPKARTVGVATGANFPDGVVGGADMVSYGGPLLLLPATLPLPPEIAAYLHAVAPLGRLNSYGGSRAIPADLLGEVGKAATK